MVIGVYAAVEVAFGVTLTLELDAPSPTPLCARTVTV